MTRPLRVLIVEDNSDDAELLLRELRRAGFEPNATRVDTEADYLDNLHPELELILSDYAMPQFSGLRALELLKQWDLPIPFILVSATIGEEAAILAMRSGAVDYLLKDRLARLGQAVEQALEQKRLRDEHERAEERLREQADMLNLAHDAIIVRNFQDRRIVFWNSGAERLYGWSASEAIGQPIGELILANPQELDTISKTLLATGEFRGQLKEITKDKRELAVDVSSTLVRNVDGTPRSVLSVNNDVTEQKKLEGQLLRAQRLENIGTLASGVAHDLNNILTPILMCAETLRRDLGQEDRQLALSLIEESARRGAGVVKQVLTFARGIEGERVTINPRHLVDEMVDIARKTFPKSIETSPRYSENLRSIQGDPTQLHQVLLNLSVNARDAMPEGGSLVISAENFDVDQAYASMTPEAKPGAYVALRVSDTGAGMARATIEKIFDPFFTTKEVDKGTGLGLSTALGIVKSHGGFISVYSEQGRGTTFKIFLPAVESETDSAKTKTLPEQVRGNGQLILLVDDEKTVRSITKMVLEKNNYRILEASDGPEALAVFAQQLNFIDVVVTDITMPYMDGVAVVRAIKRMKPEALFIASTGQGEETRVPELQSLNVTNFLTKPYDTERLLKVLHDTLTRKSGKPGEIKSP